MLSTLKRLEVFNLLLKVQWTHGSKCLLLIRFSILFRGSWTYILLFIPMGQLHNLGICQLCTMGPPPKGDFMFFMFFYFFMIHTFKLNLEFWRSSFLVLCAWFIVHPKEYLWEQLFISIICLIFIINDIVIFENTDNILNSLIMQINTIYHSYWHQFPPIF